MCRLFPFRERTPCPTAKGVVSWWWSPAICFLLTRLNLWDKVLLFSGQSQANSWAGWWYDSWPFPPIVWLLWWVLLLAGRDLGDLYCSLLTPLPNLLPSFSFYSSLLSRKLFALQSPSQPFLSDKSKMLQLYQEWSEKAGGKMGLWKWATHWLASNEPPLPHG